MIAQVDGQLVRWIAPLHTALVKLDLASLQSLTEVVLAADAETPVLSVEVDGMVTAIPILVETLTYDSDLAGQSTIPANPIQVDDPDFNNAQRVYAPGLLELTWAWRYTMGAPEIILAVIDSGVNAQHPDLSGRLLAGYDFVNNDNDPQDDHGHGTHIAGIIAAVANNGIGSAGICPLCSILPIKVLDADNTGTWSNVATGIVYAVDNGAQVINLSLGGSSNPPQIIQDAIQYAATKGVLVVAAAGNSRSDEHFYPAAMEDVLAVSATRHDNSVWSLSNFGDWVDVSAPGYALFSTYHALDNYYGGYTFMSGTSMAAPHVTGLAGLLLSQQPTRTPADLRRLLVESATDLGDPGVDVYFGAGRINANQALALESPPPKADAVLGGVIWQDNNLNQCQDENENRGGIPLTVRIFQEDRLIASIMVAGDSEWRIGGLIAGEYQVKATAENGFTLTTAPDYRIEVAESSSVLELHYGVVSRDVLVSQDLLFLPMVSQ